MSYILDALRKAEEARAQGAQTALASAHAAAPLRRENRPVRNSLFAACLILGIVSFGWWLSPWRADKESAVISKEAVGNVAPPVEEVREKFPESEVVTQLPPERDKRQSLKISPKKAVSEAVLPEAVRPSPSRNAGGPGERVAKKEVEATVNTSHDVPVSKESGKKEVSVTTGESEFADAGRVYALNELPSSVKQGIPSLSLALHYYTSDPGSRLVTIDDRTLRQGEELSPGLKLEEITRTGAVFCYRKYRFFVGISR